MKKSLSMFAQRTLLSSGLMVFTLMSSTAFAQIQSAQSGDWGNATTWAGGVVPTAAHNVEILNGHNVRIAGGTLTRSSANTAVTVKSGGTLTLAANLTLGNSTSKVIVETGGRLAMGHTRVIGGSGAVNINDGAFVEIGHRNGINGNITTTVKNYSPAAHYVFNNVEFGQAPVLGSELPSTITGSVTIKRALSFTLSGTAVTDANGTITAITVAGLPMAAPDNMSTDYPMAIVAGNGKGAFATLTVSTSAPFAGHPNAGITAAVLSQGGFDFTPNQAALPITLTSNPTRTFLARSQARLAQEISTSNTRFVQLSAPLTIGAGGKFIVEEGEILRTNAQTITVNTGGEFQMKNDAFLLVNTTGGVPAAIINNGGTVNLNATNCGFGAYANVGSPTLRPSDQVGAPLFPTTVKYFANSGTVTLNAPLTITNTHIGSGSINVANILTYSNNAWVVKKANSFRYQFWRKNSATPTFGYVAFPFGTDNVITGNYPVRADFADAAFPATETFGQDTIQYGAVTNILYSSASGDLNFNNELPTRKKVAGYTFNAIANIAPGNRVIVPTNNNTSVNGRQTIVAIDNIRVISAAGIQIGNAAVTAPNLLGTFPELQLNGTIVGGFSSGTGGGSLVVQGSGAFNATATGAFGNITMNRMGAVLSLSNATIKGNLNRIMGTINLGGSITFDGDNNQTINNISGTVATMKVNKSSGTLTINANSTLNVSDSLSLLRGTITNNGTVRLLSTPTGTARMTFAGLVSTVVWNGNITTQRYVPGGSRYYYFGTPVKNQTTAAWAGKVGQNFYTYSPTSVDNMGWGNPLAVDATPVSAGKGYINLFGGATTLENTGMPVIGDGVDNSYSGSPESFNFGIIYSELGYSHTGFKGWNLVANPYPCEVNWTEPSGWTKTDVQPVYWTWNGTAYRFYESDLIRSGIDITKDIASGQGFFVRANSTGTPLLAINENAKVGNAPNTFGSMQAKNQLKVRMLNADGDDDVAFARFFDEATQGIDFQYDIPKLTNPGMNVSIFHPNTGSRLSVESQPMFTSSITIPLSVSGPAGTYKFNISNLETFAAGTQFFLVDEYTNTITDLSTHPEYEFTISAVAESQGDNRFKIVTTPIATSLQSAFDAANISVFPNPASEVANVMFTGFEHINNVQVRLTDLSGKTLLTERVNLATAQYLHSINTSKLPAGVYLMSIEAEGLRKVEKLVIK